MMRKSPIGRLLAASLFVGFAAGLAHAAPLEAEDGSWYFVTGRNVNVRCAPNVSRSYSVGRLQKEDRVFVVGETNGWATIQTTGPAFTEVFGLLRANAQVKEDGSTVEILAATQLMAPNLAAKNDPARSWHTFASLTPGTTLDVSAAFDDDQNQRHLLVSLPETTNVFVNMAFLKQEETTTPTVKPMPAVEPKDEPEVEPTPAPKPTTTVEVIEVIEITTPEPSETVDTTLTNKSGVEEIMKVEPRVKITIELAESAWAAIKKEGSLEDEIEELQQLYIIIAASEETPAQDKLLAELRIRQLQMKWEVQLRLQRLQTLSERNSIDRNRMKDAQVLIDARAEYDAVGRLNASRVYDGKRLPMLYRLSSPSGGRTIGYIRPSQQVDLLPMLGRLVGIVGSKNYDAGYRLLIVSPKRIDILTASVTD
jgi:hypothetical protein